jgi:hypothetical protein
LDIPRKSIVISLLENLLLVIGSFTSFGMEVVLEPRDCKRRIRC